MEEPIQLNRKDNRLLFWVFISVFSFVWVLVREPVEVYAAYFVFIILLPVFIGRYGIPSYFWAFSGLFLFTGVFNIFLDNDTFDQFLKIYLGLMMSYLFYYYVLRRFEFDSELIFRYYLKAAFIITVIGLIQFVSYIVKFTPGYDFRWLPFFNKWGVVSGGNLGIRINAIFGEPSQYAAVMSPAAFIAAYNIVTFKQFVFKRWQSALVLVVYLLTFSSLGYMGLLLIIFMLMYNFGVARYIFFFVPLLIITFIYLYNTVPDFSYRWDSTIHLFQTGEIDIKNEHGSSIVFYNNFVVTMENFKTNFLFGTGLGSHPVAFERYSVTKDIETFGFSNNSSDANSMLLRIISEIGLVGIILVLTFVSRNFVKRTSTSADSPYWLISSALLCIIVLYLLRQGHYFLNGFPLFVWLYYYNRKRYEAWLERDEDEIEEDDDDEITETSH